MSNPARFRDPLLRVVTAMPLFMLATGSFFLRPRADDFCTMQKRAVLGIVGGLSQEYYTWSGRYSATLLALLANGTAMWLPVVMLALWGAALYVIFNRYLDSRRAAASGAVMVMVALLSFSLSPYESYLWLQGATTYLAAITAYTLVFAVDALPIAVLLSFIAAGFSDIGALLGTVSLVALAFTARTRRWVWCAVASAAGLVLVVVAPGNAVRAAYFVQPGLLTAIGITLRSIGYAFTGQAAIIIIAALTAVAYLQSARMPRRAVPRRFVLLPFVSIGGATLVWLASAYTTGQIFDGRAWVLPGYFMLACCVGWGHCMGQVAPLRVRHHTAITALLCGLICVMAVGSSSIAIVQARGYAMSYDSGQWVNAASAWELACAKIVDPSIVQR